MAKHQIYSISLREIHKGVIINETRTDTVMYTRRQVLIKAERMGRNYFKIHPDSFYLDFNIYLEECQKPCLSVIMFNHKTHIHVTFYDYNLDAVCYDSNDRRKKSLGKSR